MHERLLLVTTREDPIEAIATTLCYYISNYAMSVNTGKSITGKGIQSIAINLLYF